MSTAKTHQLQIRITREEKEVLRRLAKAAGESVSAYVLSRVLPSRQGEFTALVGLLGGEADRRSALAEMDRLLSEVAPTELATTAVDVDLEQLPPLVRNYVAALVERAAHRKGVTPPDWVSGVAPLERPHFVWSLVSLRPYQMTATPAVFKRRNIYLDPAVGPRL